MPLSVQLPAMNDLALLGLYLIAIFYLVYTVILCYHWQEYSVSAKVTKVTLVSYFGLTLPLMLTLTIITLSL